MFRYAGDDVQGKMPQYEIGELPEGFEEEQEKYFAGEGTISRYYENDNEDVILFEYVYMQHGSMSWISTEKADIETYHGLTTSKPLQLRCFQGG